MIYFYQRNLEIVEPRGPQGRGIPRVVLLMSGAETEGLMGKYGVVGSGPGQDTDVTVVRSVFKFQNFPSLP